MPLLWCFLCQLACTYSATGVSLASTAPMCTICHSLDAQRFGLNRLTGNNAQRPHKSKLADAVRWTPEMGTELQHLQMQILSGQVFH